MNHSLALPSLLLLCVAGTAAAFVPTSAASSPVPTAVVEGGRITVSAVGTARANSSYLAIATSIEGNDDVAEVAIENFRQARQRVMAAYEGAEIDGLEVVARGLELDYAPEQKLDPNMGFVMSPGGMGAPDPGVTCSEAIEVRITPGESADTLRTRVAQAIDLAIELDLDLQSANQVNPYYYEPVEQADRPGTVEGALSDGDRDALVREAQASAMGRARVLATGLAELGGGALGPVVEVTQVDLSSSWKGLGEGMEAVANLSVTFELVR